MLVAVVEDAVSIEIVVSVEVYIAIEGYIHFAGLLVHRPGVRSQGLSSRGGETLKVIVQFGVAQVDVAENPLLPRAAFLTLLIGF